MYGSESMLVEASAQFAPLYSGLLVVLAISGLGIVCSGAPPAAMRRLLERGKRRWRAAQARRIREAQAQRIVYPLALGQDPWRFGWCVAEPEEIRALARTRR